MYLICVFISGFNNKAECCLISFANAIFFRSYMALLRSILYTFPNVCNLLNM